MTPEEFFRANAENARRVSARTGIDPRLILAQTALETGYGRSAPNNNFFGIKGRGSTQRTKEFVNGKMQSQNASFRSYSSPSESFDDYADLMMKSKRYEGVRGAEGLADQINNMAKSGYATDPQYGQKLSSIAYSVDKYLPRLISDGAMRAIGKQPIGLADANIKENSQMMQQRRPRGLLENFGIQKMQEGAEGETGQRFYNRDTFKDKLADLAVGFGKMGIMGLDEPAAAVANRQAR
jgi:hypothetical protein